MSEPESAHPDLETARAFAESWNHVGSGSVYTREQFLDWIAPIDPNSFHRKDVLELGFGNGSLLVHTAFFRPARLAGIELGDTLEETRRNLGEPEGVTIELHQGDLVTAKLGAFDFVYSIGVLHHLRDPEAGFRAVLRHTRPGGSFHVWVYAREGNTPVVLLVEPLRRISCRLPWWLIKYGIALPLAVPFFLWAKTLRALVRLGVPKGLLARFVPLAEYALWIAEREFHFFRHVAFDQLVTPRTVYIERETILRWLDDPAIDPASTYVLFRNGNSWKFGGRTREA